MAALQRRHQQPNAVKVGVGKVDALTGNPFTNARPRATRTTSSAAQPWLDGINAGKA